MMARFAPENRHRHRLPPSFGEQLDEVVMERNEVIDWARKNISAEEWPMHKGHHFNIDDGTWSGDFPALPSGFYWDKAPAFEDFQICKNGSSPSTSDYFWPIGFTAIHQ